MSYLNPSILTKEVQTYIQKNLTADITKLILKGSPFSNISVQELANQIIAKQKSKSKLPTWFAKEQIYYPDKISIEQSSSEITAQYKSDIISGKTIVDVTGGFGVDTYYFSQHFEQVVHCELNPALSEIVEHNNRILGNTNIKTFSGDGLAFLKSSDTVFDCIYIDPSRRHDTKGKVFLLKDCVPNVPDNLDDLFKKSRTILIKNSPILDIKSTLNELTFVKEIHIVAIDNEVKELLFLLEKGYSDDISIHTVNFQKGIKQCFDFLLSQKNTANYGEVSTYLYEPNAAILKSGGFQEIAAQYGVFKLHQHSHLYTSDVLIEDFPGRMFKVESVLSYDKRLKKSLGIPKANITTRNFAKSVSQLRKELKIKDGGHIYLFFSKNIHDQLIVIVCVKKLLKH